jgi:hypothetical protein
MSIPLHPRAINVGANIATNTVEPSIPFSGMGLRLANSTKNACNIGMITAMATTTCRTTRQSFQSNRPNTVRQKSPFDRFAFSLLMFTPGADIKASLTVFCMITSFATWP